IDPNVQVRGTDKSVRTTSNVPKQAPVAISYRSRQNGGSWRIVDVFYRNAISQIATRRSDFASISQRGGARSSLISPLLVPAASAFAPVTAEPAIPVPQQAIAGPVVSGAADPVSASPVVLASPAQRQDATVPATQPAEERHHHAKGDPLDGFHRPSFGIPQRIDHAVFRPAATGYPPVVPPP
ncbi:hypothetical protein OY671_009717, partial [Metschnikowia pulcherrima]